MPKGRQIVRSKKQIYDGIKFDSGLEVYMYKQLKNNGFKFEREGITYEIHPPIKLNFPCYIRSQKRSLTLKDKRDIRKISYTIDFNDKRKNPKWVIECKGRANESFPLRWKMFLKLLSEMKNPPSVFMPRNQKDCDQVIEILIKNKLK